MTEFHPQKALQSYREYSKDIEVMGKDWIDSRIAFNLAEAAWKDAENAWYKTFQKDKPVPQGSMEKWIRMNAWSEYAAYLKAENDLKLSEIKWRVTIEGLNILKAAARIATVESENLNLT